MNPGEERAPGEEIAAVGIDAGSTGTKVVAVDAAGRLVWHEVEPSEPRMGIQAARLLDRVPAARAVPVVATGYGRGLVAGAERRVTEITCHARGIWQALGRQGLLVDVGGQDSKAILVGEGGRVLHFAMNDKCAAGTGRFLEVTAGRLGLGLGEIGPAALTASRELPISSTCTVFAESEIVSLVAAGEPIEAILRGLHRSLARRVAALVRSLGPRLDRGSLMVSGGGALNPALVAFLGEELGVGAAVAPEPLLVGAWGAALAGLARG